MAEDTTTQPADAHLAPNQSPADPEQIGPYRIIEKLGAGGMGLVYKAEQRQPVRRIVALKVIKLGMDTREVVARFEAERQALAMLSHPHVAKVLDAGITDTGRPYFAMEFVAGVPLREYCDQNKLTVRERLELFIPVCQAIQHAHHKGIIHRDLKPSNILVSMFDGKPVPKVIDFGIAKATNQQLTQHTLYTQTGAMMGTPEYMSPEQAMTSGLDVDTRTDIYSLGVILYELLTGTLPFDPKALRTAGMEGMARMIRETEPPKPSTRLTAISIADALDPAALHRTDPRTFRRQIRGDLDWITLKAMEKDRTRRYETANGLAMDLERYLDDEPVLARPPSSSYRAAKFIRKHKIGVAAVCAVASALILGIIGTTLGLLRARQSRDLAVQASAEAGRQRASAEQSRDDANAATRFLRDVAISFGASGTDAASRMGPEIKRLDGGWLADQPETAMGCRVAIGFTLLHDNPAASERQFNAALELARTRGIDIPELTARIYEGLGLLHLRRDELPAAENYFRQSAADFQRFRTPSSELGEVYTNLSAILDRENKADQAVTVRLDALAAFVRGRTADLALQPGNPADYLARARYLLRAGKFKGAMPDLIRATEGNDHFAWYYLALLQLLQGDEPAYRVTAGEMLKRFGNSPDPRERERTVKVCALTPTLVGDVDQLDSIVNSVLASNFPFLQWFQQARGIVEFRAGRWQPATDALNHVLGLSPCYTATAEFIFAMIHHRQGHLREAREIFDRAENRSKKITAPGTDDFDHVEGSIENYLTMEVFRREAESVFNQQ
ncbi:MAG TPA: protein kinase [Tepidisphaeraceae bacterium]|jgi:serine/threonine protein kinase|nr:protein kinase [Tepidisphaeraceae bacterium]